jgi:hypothetical protein
MRTEPSRYVTQAVPSEVIYSGAAVRIYVAIDQRDSWALMNDIMKAAAASLTQLVAAAEKNGDKIEKVEWCCIPDSSVNCLGEFGFFRAVCRS